MPHGYSMPYLPSARKQTSQHMINDMLYMKFKSLGFFKLAWEAYLQHVNTCKILALFSNAYISTTRNLEAKSEECIKLLKLYTNDSMIRKILQEREVYAWAALPQKGLGVELCQEYTPANSWIRHHDRLPNSEWREGMKMTANVSAVRAVPGRSKDSNLYQHCRRETETLAQILGSCHGEMLLNKDDYLVKADHQLSDQSIYQSLTSNTIESYNQ